ncbi:hypothetical protein JOM56_004380 [Amanita muscaria]
MASTGTAPPIPPNISDGTTPLLIGILLDYFLFGVLTMQTFIYYQSFPDDKLYAKLLVYSSYFIELVQVACAAANIDFWFGAGFGNLDHLNSVHLSPFDTPLIGSLVAFIVQLFFCYRIWVLRMSDRKLYIFMCGLIGLISVMQLVGGVAGSVIAYNGKTFQSISTSQPALVLEVIWLFGEALADVLIAGTMTYLLLGSVHDSEKYVRYPTVANRIVRLIVQTNSLTAGMAVIALVLRMAFPGKVYFVLPTFMLGKLYSNTLLATFNHRLFLRKPQNEPSQQKSGSGSGSGAVYRSMEISKTVEMDTLKETSTLKHMGQSSVSSTAISVKAPPLVTDVLEVPPAPKRIRPLPARPGVDDVRYRSSDDLSPSTSHITTYS